MSSNFSKFSIFHLLHSSSRGSETKRRMSSEVRTRGAMPTGELVKPVFMYCFALLMFDGKTVAASEDPLQTFCYVPAFSREAGFFNPRVLSVVVRENVFVIVSSLVFSFFMRLLMLASKEKRVVRSVLVG